MADCVPLSLLDGRERCRDINSFILKRISEEKPDFVVLAAYYNYYADWQGYKEKIPYNELIKEKTSEMLRYGAQKIIIIIIGQIPTWHDSLPHSLFRNFVLKNKEIPNRTFEGVNTASLEYDTILKNQLYSKNVYYLSLKDFLCNKDGCLTSTGKDLTKDLIVFDYGHLTEAGAKLITQNLISNYLN